MKTVFDQTTIDELVARINALDGQSGPVWGKMNVFQMLRHCTLSEEMFQGKTSYKRLFVGRLFGGMALKQLLENENPMKKNQPTHPLMRITGNGDWREEREKWIGLIRDYNHFRERDFVHPFFGKMNREQIGRYVYKHADHHLRQFGS